MIDRLVPAHFDDLAVDFRQAVSTSAFPRVFEGVRPEPLVPVPPPNAEAMLPAVQNRVRRSVVKVTGDAPTCDRGQEGSGAVIAPERVITNAHVVAGVRNPVVQLAGQRRQYRATVVLFDPRTDVAVLAVPRLPAPALPLGGELGRGDDAVVAGYPGNGPYTAVPARIRARLSATGEDIYGAAGAVRQVYSLYTTVEQGNSGGPLLSIDGELAGVVFAKSLDDADTGYALTLTEVAAEIAAGITADARVDTAGCTVG
jgi:S1-C subfamily serine protease